MNKIVLGVGVIILAVFAYFAFTGNTANYVATVADEVAALETELAELDAAVEAGTLTPEAAARAQAKILTRLDAINQAVADSENASLTPAQRTTLINGLASLQNTLTKYRATLVTVDSQAEAAPAEVKAELNRSGGGGRAGRVSALAAIETTIDTVEEFAEEVVEDLDTALEELLEEVAEDELPSEEIDEAVGDDAVNESNDEATASDPGSDPEDDTMTESDATEADTETSSDTTTDETDADADVSVEAESTFGFTTDANENDTATSN